MDIHDLFYGRQIEDLIEDSSSSWESLNLYDDQANVHDRNENGYMLI